jgi:hypothetical protein
MPEIFLTNRPIDGLGIQVEEIGILGQFVTVTVSILSKFVEEGVHSLSPLRTGELIKMPSQEDSGMKGDQVQKA